MLSASHGKRPASPTKCALDIGATQPCALTGMPQSAYKVFVMKKLTLTVTIFGVFCALVYAGPEAFSGKEMKQVAPAPVPECPNWTGFYIGGLGGYKFAASDIRLDLGGEWNSTSSDRADRDVLEARGSEDLDTSGAELGGLIGYNYQWNKWVLGLEASGGYLWLRDSDETEIFVIAETEHRYSLRTSLKTHYLVTVGPRIGYAFCRWLPYVTGGLAVGDIGFDQIILQHGSSGTFFDEGGSTSDTKAGWMVGAGLQYAITDHWSARAQYQYVDLGCADFDSVGSVGNEGYVGNHEACLREHNASFAIIYKF
jgi:outer membrane immunogenic protein